MNKQTAVEWFVKQLLGNGLLRVTKDEQLYKELRDQVRAMEREQIEEAYKKGCMDEIDKRIESCVEESCKTDYNETYKGGEQ